MKRPNLISLCILGIISTVNSCWTPKNIVEFNWNPSEVDKDGYYHPMGSFSKFSQNSQNITLPGFSKNCPVRFVWSSLSPLTTFSGCGKEVKFECIPTHNNLWMFDCKHLMRSDDFIDLSHRVYGTLTDNKSFAFLNRCFYNIQQEDWIVFSTTEDLPSTTKHDILVHGAAQDYWKSVKV